MTRRQEQSAITLILLLAAVLRFGALGDVPPGLAHDEVANWLIARDILAGRHAIYFTAAYGHEPLYQYAQAATVALFGDHWLGLRYPSVAFGLLGLAVTYVLIRRLFGAPVALLTGGWLATSFWPIFYARVALRAISLPFIAALAAYFFFRAIDRRAKPRMTNWLLSGIFVGLSLYTYMAARILPVILVTFLVYLSLGMPVIRVYLSPHPWSRILVFLLIVTIVSAPLLIWLVTHPGAEFRIAEVQKPLNRLLEGDPSLVWQNFVANLKFFTIAGDPWPRQNIPGRPVFADPVSAALFYAGLLVAVWRWRDPRYGFLLIWLLGALGPSVATTVAPSSIRDILGLVVVFVFPALALVEAGRWIKEKLQFGVTAAAAVRNLQFAACILFLAPCLFLTVRDYFFVWPQNEDVRFDYQSDLTIVAHQLDELVSGTPATVAGLSVHSMDGPGLELVTRRDVYDVRLCDTRETLLIPAGCDAWLFVLQVVPFDVDLRGLLLGWGAIDETGPQSSFVSYHLPDDTALRRDMERLATTVILPTGDPVALPVSFDGYMAFWGYEWLGHDAVPGKPLTLLTYWRVEQPPPNSLRIFVHLMGESDIPVAQHDGLGSPSRGWSSGDWIVQKHVIQLPSDLPAGLYTPQLGLYNAPTGPRLSISGTDRLLLSTVEIGGP
ncbi:MAG: glycosyltransferase family 39 protein [Chloroflexi bacterium]|nr:glycosyltransferase family 39 protein [Chloroflexota bacterium]